MKFRKLGTTDIDVSLICLGTMTWGTQNTEKDAFAQMDYAVSQGVNFFGRRDYLFNNKEGNWNSFESRLEALE